jgi:hypothetical protein
MQWVCVKEYTAFARSWRKTTRLRFNKLRRGKQFMPSEGPVFALMSYASAGNSWLKTTFHRRAKWVLNKDSNSVDSKKNGFSQLLNPFFIIYKWCRKPEFKN